VTLVPLAWLVSVTMTASYQKIFDADPRMGFWAQARHLTEQISSGAIPAANIAATQRVIFNNRLDAVVTAMFAGFVVVILVESGRNWWLYVFGGKKAVLSEAPMEVSRLTA
jgi:carbon starvation protein